MKAVTWHGKREPWLTINTSCYLAASAALPPTWRWVGGAVRGCRKADEKRRNGDHDAQIPAPLSALAGIVLIVTLVSGCGRAEGPTPLGTPNASEVGEVTVVSDDSRATVSPVCVEDIPADLTTCAGAPANLGQLQLDQTRKATVQLPTEVATGGYRLRVNGAPLPDLADVLHDKAQPLRVPVTVVQEPGETVLTVEALSSFAHPRAVWQFLLADPAGPPA